MKFVTVFIISGLCLFTGTKIKTCSGQNLNSPLSLCWYKKTKNTCLCNYKTDVSNDFPIFKADCTRMEMEEFPRDSQLINVEDLDLSHNVISTLDPYKNNFASFKMRSIKLSFNKITHIAQDFFRNTPNLLELDLSNNEIVTFPNSNIFRGLQNLKILNLGFNNLPTLPDDIFLTLANLQQLDLRHNYMGSLLMNSRNLFNTSMGLSANITTLKLDGLEITSLHYSYFDGAEHIKYLSLANNPLEEIPEIPYSLDYLDLSGTDITTLSARYLNCHSLKVLKLNGLKRLEKIEHYAFYNLQALQELHLSDCSNLREFSDLAFGIVANNLDLSLKKITLARSGLRNINSTYLRLFNKMEHVDLQSNPWVCNCDILWLQELNGSLYRGDNLRCRSPYYLVNKKIMDLTEKDMPSCAKNVNYVQRILISVLGSLVAILIILIIYLMYLGPFYHKNKYRGIGPESPYQGNTIGIIPARAENLD